MFKKSWLILNKIIAIAETYIYIQLSKKNKRYFRAILFSSYDHRYSDNSKHLYEYLLQKGYNVYYVTNNVSCINKIYPNSKELHSALKTCSAVCFTHTENDISAYIPKPVIRINLWHGSPIKKMGFDSPVDRRWLKKYSFLPIKNPYQRWDYLVVQNSLFSDFFISALRCGENKLLKFGLPRNDILGTAPPDLINKTYKALGVSRRSHNILYAPTFRDGEFDIIQACEDLKVLVSKLQNSKLLLRLHPFDKAKVPPGFYNEVAVDANKIEDPQDLLNIADTLITDYSSIAFDYASLDRKIILYCPDHREYEKTRGGLYFELTELPFTYCVDIQSVEHALLEEETYKYSALYPRTEAKEKIENFLLKENLLSSRVKC